MSTGRAGIVGFSLILAFMSSGCGMVTADGERSRAEAAAASLLDQSLQKTARADELARALGADAQAAPGLVALLTTTLAAVPAPMTPAEAFDPATLETHLSAHDRLDRALAGVERAIDADPQLRARPELAMIRLRLRGIERRVAVARLDYADAALAYNRRIGSLPRSIWRGALTDGGRSLPTLEPTP